MKKLLNRLKLRRLEKRGEVVLNQAVFWEFIDTLATDLIPGPKNEIPRDLLRILAFWWAATDMKNDEEDPYEVLRFVREKAWLGYTNMPDLLRRVQADFPDTVSRQRILNYFEELGEKKSPYLFLPVVSRIDRHQSVNEKSTSLVDDIMSQMGSSVMGLMAQKAFLLAPHATRERAVFLLALTTQNWGRKQEVTSTHEVYMLAANQLRRLYNAPQDALAAVEADAADNRLARYLTKAGRETATGDNRAVLLETLYIVESWIAGPQHFDHAFEITETWHDFLS